MADSIYDLVIIGGGPGGYVAAIRAAQLGLRTAVVERDQLGGVCLNWGCIPSKALLRNAEVVRLVRDAGDFGIKVERFTADYSAAQQRSRTVSNRLVKGIEFLMKKHKVEVVRGTATISAPDRVRIAPEDRELRTKHIILATGARPRSIPGVAVDGQKVITSREALELKEVPSPVVIVGASAVGVEFATIFRSYGAEVTLIELLPHLLPREDEEVSLAFEKAMEKAGIHFRTGAKVQSVAASDGQLQVKVSSGEKAETVSASKVLVATGVQPNVENLGLEKLGVALERGAIKVDNRCQTSVAGVFAIGDVTMKLPLAHFASAQGVMVAEILAGKTVHPVDPNRVPRCTYSSPQVASLGLTESEARTAGHEVKIGKFPFRANGKALGLHDYEGFVKLVVDAKYGELLGAHLIGPEVTELTGELSLAKSMELTPMELASAIHAHPTLTEAIGEAALEIMGGAIHI